MGDIIRETVGEIRTKMERNKEREKKEIERNKEKKREAHTKKKIENVPELDLRMLLWLEFKLNSFSLI